MLRCSVCLSIIAVPAVSTRGEHSVHSETLLVRKIVRARCVRLWLTKFLVWSGVARARAAAAVPQLTQLLLLLLLLLSVSS